MPDLEKIPLVSFCMSTYKRPELLKETLNTICRQNFPDFEVIISDNDPENSAQNIVSNIKDPRFKYFSNGKNLGMIQSFNLSVERASAEYIIMLADDDPVYYDMTEILVNLTELYPGYGMYLGGCDWFCPDVDIARMHKLNIGTNSCLSNEFNLNHVQTFTAEEFLTLFFSFKIFPHYLWSTCMVRKSIIIEKGGIPDYGTPFLGDYAYLSIMSSHSGCVVINRSLGCQTVHSENFGRNQNDQLVTAVRKFPEYVGERLKHLPLWPSIEKQMLNFVGLWVVSHLAFLNTHFRKGNDNSLRNAQTEIFKIDYMKKHKLKYKLKKHTPIIHDQIVSLKKRLNK